ncbi:MAG: hypothetical protein FWH42_02315 [Dehalococcoidia bacterium]|nr:hypothetical protein [Dehalococcoidia bacterium]
MKKQIIPMLLVCVFVVGVLIDLYCFRVLQRNVYFSESLWTRNRLITTIVVSSVVGLIALTSAVFIKRTRRS